MPGPEARPLVAVLGASGLLGTAITRELATRPIRLRLVGRRPVPAPAGGPAAIEVRRCDLTAPGELAAAVAGAAAVVHLVAHTTGAGAWRSAESDEVAERVNVGLVHDLVSAIAGRRGAPAPVVVFAGSASQAGRPAGPRLDGTERDEPLTAYDRHKLAAERALRAATAEGIVRATTLRLTTLFGAGTDPGAIDRGVVAAMSRRALAGQPLTMWHDGTVRRDLLCADDAARAFVAALDHPDALAGRHWPVGTGEATTIAELFAAIAATVAAVTGRPAVPVARVAPPGEAVGTDLVDCVADPSAFRDATGWSPRVPLPEALDRLARCLAGRRPAAPAPGAGPVAASLPAARATT
jgi:nucleoside-diphosphate-sugar epimerase